MKIRYQTIALSVAVRALFASSSAFAADLPPNPDFDIDVGSSAARSLIVSNGQSLRFHLSMQDEKSVSETPLQGPRIQWIKDNEIISDGTNHAFGFSSVSFSNVGTYSVWVNGPKGKQESAPIHVSVYSLFYSNSNGGCLGVPIGDFYSGTYPLCPGTFDRYKVYFPFYGPNAANQSGLFINNSSSANLDVTTCTNINGTVNSAVKIQENWLPMYQKVCNDDDVTCLASTSLSTANATSLSTNSSSSNTYRTTIYYSSSSLGTNNKVTFRWYYHN